MYNLGLDVATSSINIDTGFSITLNAEALRGGRNFPFSDLAALLYVISLPKSISLLEMAQGV